MGWLVWRSGDKAGGLMAGLAAFALACWLLDAAARHWSLRRLSVGLELVSGALLGGGFAFVAANSSGSPSLWLVGGAAIFAMAVVAQWRGLAYQA